MIDGILGTALEGVYKGLEQAAESADEISKAFTPLGNGDVVTPAVKLSLANQQVAANTSVIKVADEMSKETLRILDVVA